MLGSLARKLRIFGFDTLYIKTGGDDEIISLGIGQGRVILTCDNDMYNRILKAGARGILLNCSNDVENIANIFFNYHVLLGQCTAAKSRCSACNGSLRKRYPAEVKEEIPFNVFNSHEQFFQCERCNKLFWEGSHFLHLRSLAIRVDNLIKEHLRETSSSSTCNTNIR